MERLNLTHIILLFAFLLTGGLGLLVYLKKSPHRRVNLSFSVFAWASASWILSVLMVYWFDEPAWKLFWVRMSFVGPSIIPASFFYFALVFPKEDRRVSFSRTLLIFALAVVFVSISFTPWMVRSVNWDTLKANYGIAHPIFSIYFLILMSAGIFSLIQSYRRAIGLERIQIKYCFLGIFLTFIPTTTLNLILPWLGTSRLSHLGPAMTIILISFSTYAILERRFMDIDLFLKKGTTYGLLMLLLFVPSCLLIVYAQELFYDKIDHLFTLFMFSLLLLVTLLFNRIKEQAEKAVEQLFFKNRYDYHDTLSRFSKALVTILDLQSLSTKIIETVTQTMGVEKASLFYLDEEKAGYHLLESKNVIFRPSPLILPTGDPLVHHLGKRGEIIIREELAKASNIPELADVLERLTLLEAEVSIPLISKGQLIGMINLSHKFDRDVYSQEDLALLGTLANQTAIALENARLYEGLKRSKSYIRRADRLASLGTLTAGLAHEIRNPLVAIKTLTQLLPERFEDEEFRNHFLHIASDEVDRISSLVNELLEFARPSDPKFDLESINTILDGMVLLVSTEAKKKQIRTLKQYDQELPLVTVDREQIKQVFLNILLNAIEATPPCGTILVKTRSFVKPAGEPLAQIEITDSGCGIPTQYLEDIFTPFFTTKSKGSGLGLAICNQIVQDHRGYIDVVSQVNQGASFLINLPIRQDHPQRRRSDPKGMDEMLEVSEQP
jgi:signal transduction histidine kinase